MRGPLSESDCSSIYRTTSISKVLRAQCIFQKVNNKFEEINKKWSIV